MLGTAAIRGSISYQGIFDMITLPLDMAADIVKETLRVFDRSNVVAEI